MKPILFPQGATDFTSLGLGILSETSACTVTEERNGAYELELQYPVSGRRFSQIRNRCIIVATVNRSGDKQPFRIYKITKPLRGVITVYAAHLSYDLSGVVVAPFAASSATEAMAGLELHSAGDNPFSFYTDKATVASFRSDVPMSVRALMGGREGSILDVYGGEYAYDGFTVKLLSARGQNRGVTIRYGKNLTDLNQEENIQNAYTGVYPYWSSDGEYLELPEQVLYGPGSHDFVKIRPLDASSAFEDKPTEEQLRSWATSYMERNDIGVPNVSISVSFVPLEQTEEYKDIAVLQQVYLCDTVTVKFDRLGVDATAKCVKTVFDVLKNRYSEIVLGDARTNIADTITAQAKAIERVSDPTYIQNAAASATELITGNKGGYVVLHSSTGGKAPDEILVMDTPSTATATQVWRWNKSGLGYSSNGYDGPFDNAFTMAGEFVADFIKAGTLDANLINVINLIAEKIISKSDTTEMSIQGGIFAMKDRSSGSVLARIDCDSTGVPCMEMYREVNSESSNRWMVKPNEIRLGYALSPNFRVTVGGSNPEQQTSDVQFDSLSPSGEGNCKWEYNSTLGKTILVKV